MYLWTTIYVLWRAPRQARSLGFAGIAVCFAWWSATLVLAHDPDVSRAEAAMAYNLGAVGWASFASFALWFGLAFAGVRRPRWLVPALAVPALVSLVAQWRGLIAADYVHESWGWAYVPADTVWTWLYYAYYTAFIGAALAIMFVVGRRSTDRFVRRQASIIVYTALVPLTCASATDVVLPWLGSHAVPNIAPAFLLAWTTGIAIAIVRYRLLEITPETAAAQILTALAEGVVLVDPEGRVMAANPAALRLLAGATVPDGDTVEASGRTLAVTRSQVHDPRGELAGTIVVLRDVTEQESAARALREAHDQLESRVAARTRELAESLAEQQRLAEGVAQSERLASIGVLAAGVAHEINNPLTYLSLGLHEIQDGLARASVDRSLSERVREALDGTERISKIVRELGSFAKHGDEVRVHTIHEPLEAAIAMASHSLRARADIERDFRATGSVRADPGRIRQLFLNLLVDAAQAIPDGTRRTLRLSTRDDGDGIAFYLRDADRRIPAEDVPRLFEMFARGPGASGLGLAISHKIARNAGGTVAVTSGDDGTTFAVHLPRAGAGPLRAPTPPPVATPPPPAVEAGRVLIIDDDALVGGALRRMLSEHRTTIAMSGVEAQGILSDRERDFDVVLCDVMMTDTTGPKLYGWMREHRPELAQRVVFMTGGTFTPEAESFVDDLRALVVLAKPFDQDVVRRVVREHVAKARAAQSSSVA